MLGKFWAGLPESYTTIHLTADQDFFFQFQSEGARCRKGETRHCSVENVMNFLAPLSSPARELLLPLMLMLTKCAVAHDTYSELGYQEKNSRLLLPYCAFIGFEK